MADREMGTIPITPEELPLPPSILSPPGLVDDSSPATTPLDPSGSSDPMSPATSNSPTSPDLHRRVPSLRTISDPQQSHMSPSSSLCGTLNTARRPPPSAGSLPVDLMQKARALQQQRMGRPPLSTQSPSPGQSNDGRQGAGSPITNSNLGGALPGGLPGGLPANLGLPGPGGRPLPPGFRKSAPVVPSAPSAKKPPSLSERRAMKLGGLPGSGSPAGPTPKLSDINGGPTGGHSSVGGDGKGSNLSEFKNYIDTEKGWITFEGAATITRTGVNFVNGQTFSISLDEVEVLEELGKGNYGTVYRVRHSRPRNPRFGMGLGGPKANARQSSASEKDGHRADSSPFPRPAAGSSRTTSGVVMAMKEIRLELDESKFTTILKELVILHECVSPHIIDFYGAFFQEGAVYMCIEYMDGGSIDKLYSGGIPEDVLRKITYATIMGLKTLKDDHNIIHRDVKPTNILVNTRGQVKICDFGVSGNLVASIAKTNIGCQSYMAPERISGGGMTTAGNTAGGTYSVQSDIWSLGLTIVECAMGRYPYPPEVSTTIFSQLSAIVEGEPPGLPTEGYSSLAQDFVRSCVNKIPAKRHTYPMLLAHPWIKSLAKPATIAEDAEAEEAAAQGELSDLTQKLDLGPDEGNSSRQDRHGGNGVAADDGSVHDPEVAEWVRRTLEQKSKGILGSGTAKSDTVRPALHAVPLDSVSPNSPTSTRFQ